MKIKVKRYFLILLFIFTLTLSIQTLGTKKLNNRKLTNISPDLSAISVPINAWNISWGGEDYENGEYIASDSAGNIYIAGVIQYNITYDVDIILIKYNINFEYQWNYIWGGNNSEYCSGIVIDSYDNIYVSGYTESFGAGYWDFFLFKCNSSGDQQWYRTWGGIDLDRCYGLAIDSNDNILLAGYSRTFDDNGFLVKFNSLGTQLWNRTFTGGEMHFYEITIDSNDNIYCVGNYWDVITWSWDCGVVKYNSNGDQQWYHTWGGNDYDSNYGITIDRYLNIYVVGRTRKLPEEEDDICIFKYDDLGNLLWYRIWNRTGDEDSQVIEIDALTGNIYILGATSIEDELSDSFVAVFNPMGIEIMNLTWPIQLIPNSQSVFYSDILLYPGSGFYLCGAYVKIGESLEDVVMDIFLSKFIYYLNTIYLEIVDQVFTTTAFNITFNISSIDTFSENIIHIENAIINMWWDGVNVSSNIQNLGDGLYKAVLNPIFVDEGDDPILLNMTISVLGYKDKYYETYLAIEPIDVLSVEIIELVCSTNHFNFTFFVCNKSGNGVDFASIQMWWNDTDVSGDVQNLGNGLYFVSLEPLIVASGEDPILLKMVISASGYEEKLFEMYLAIDPDMLEKQFGHGAERIPLVIIIIAIISIGAGIGITSVAIYLMRKRKQATELI